VLRRGRVLEGKCLCLMDIHSCDAKRSFLAFRCPRFPIMSLPRTGWYRIHDITFHCPTVKYTPSTRAPFFTSSRGHPRIRESAKAGPCNQELSLRRSRPSIRRRSISQSAQHCSSLTRERMCNVNRVAVASRLIHGRRHELTLSRSRRLRVLHGNTMTSDEKAVNIVYLLVLNALFERLTWPDN